MITSADIYDLTKGMSAADVAAFNDRIAEELKPCIFPYLERLGLNPGTPERPRMIQCPLCGNGARTPCAKVWSENGSYLLKCFSCGHKAVDVIALSQELRGGNWYDAVADVLNTCGGEVPAAPIQRAAPKEQPTEPVSPPAEWTAKAAEYIDACCKKLWSAEGSTARAYLMDARGLNERTLKKFRVGFDPRPRFNDPLIIIPSFVPLDDPATCSSFIPMRVKRRRLNPREGQGKYNQLTGSAASCPFNASALLHDPYVFLVEGEIDVMTIWQEGVSIGAAVTFGATSHSPDAVIWRDWLKWPELLCICGDNDDPGRAADAKKHADMFRLAAVRADAGRKTDAAHIFRASLPEGVKDWNEYYTGGGNIARLMEDMLEREK